MDLTRRRAIVLIAVVILALGALVAADQLIERVSPWDYDDFERWMHDLGAWGPAAYIAFLALSMVFAPLPTTPLPLAAATAWGAVLGVTYTLIAGAIGGSICFLIARCWGRRVYEHFMPATMVAEIDRTADRLAVRALIALRLFPLLGADYISYAAGLTAIRFRLYLAITIVFSLPSVILISVIGENVREDRSVAAIAIGVLAAFLILPLVYVAARNRRGGGPAGGEDAADSPGLSDPSTAADASPRRPAAPR
jgi:uncharacterized membrane protein YdjX (TVP38/TMEM64 family)